MPDSPTASITVRADVDPGVKDLLFALEGIGVFSPLPGTSEAVIPLGELQVLGAIHVWAIARNSLGQWASDDRVVYLRSSTDPSEVLVTPDKLLLSLGRPQQRLSILGRFPGANGVDRWKDLSLDLSTRLQVSAANGHVAVGSTGNVAGVLQGASQVNVAVGNISIGIPVTVECNEGCLTVEPAVGPITGGTVVRVSGFGVGSATEVLFGGAPALRISRVDPNTVDVVAPSHPPGQVTIQIVVPGAGSASSVNAYLYEASAVISLALNGTTFAPGQTMAVVASLASQSAPSPVDIYVALRLPDGQLLSLQLGGRLLPGLRPIANRVIPFPFTIQLIGYRFNGQEPRGQYTWIAAATKAGTLEVVGSIQSVSFVVP